MEQQQQAPEDFLSSYQAKQADGLPADSLVDPDEFLRGYGAPVPAAVALQKALAPNSEGPARLTSLAGQAIGTGLTEALGTPGNLEQLADGLLPSSMVGSNPKGFLPTSADLLKKTNAIGLTGRLTPESPVERYGSAALEGAAAGAPLAATGGGLLPAIAAGAGGGLGGQVAQDLAPGVPGVGAIAGVLGGAGLQRLETGVSGALALRAAKQEVETTGQQLEAAKVAALSAGDKAPLQVLKQSSKASLDAQKNLLTTQRDQALQGAQDQIGQVAGGLGTSQTLQEAGAHAQDAARNWLTTDAPAAHAAAWAPVDAKVADDAPGSLHTVMTALEDMNGKAGVLAPLAALLKPSLPAALQRTLQGTLDNPAGKVAKPATQVPSSILDSSGNPLSKEVPGEEAQPVTWGDMRQLRTTFGDAMSNPKILNDIGAQNMNRIYGALTTDMNGVARENGAGKEFSAANAESQRLFGIAEGPISRIIASSKATAADPKPEDVASSLLGGGKKGASDLATLREIMPQATNELAAAHLRQPGAWQKLAPEAQLALVPDAGARTALDGAFGQMDQAPQDFKSATAAAIKAHQENITQAQALAQQQLRAANDDKLKAVGLSQSAQEKLQQLVAKPQDSSINALHALLGERVGEQVAGTIGPALHAAGLGAPAALLGAAAPMALRAIKNPKLLRPYAAGAIGGAGVNALYPIGEPQGR